MELQPAGGDVGGGGRLQHPAQHGRLGRAGHHQQDALGRQDLRQPQGDRPAGHCRGDPAEGAGVLGAGAIAELHATADGLRTAGRFVETHMAVEPQPQHLQADAPRRRQRGGVAARLHLRIGGQAVRKPHPGGIEP